MKKRFSMLIALVMLLTSLVPSFTANAAFTDVTVENPYREAISTLSTLNVIKGYDDGSFGVDKEITRAEFTAIIVRMLGLDHLSTPITTFPDVKADHWANANIKTAFDLGIINGFDDGTFRPDSPVTYEQALKMILCTLGYEPFAEASGGYPTGYTTQAASLKMTDKVAGLMYSANAPRGVIAQVMFNSLKVPKYEDVGGILTDTGKTLLKNYLNVIDVKGTLIGVGDSTTAECNISLYQTQIAVLETSTDEVHVINIGDYEITASELISMLGNTVQVLFQKDRMSDDKALFSITNEIYKNVEVTVKSTEITEYTGNAVKYRKAGSTKTETATIDMQNLSIRYNGRAVVAPQSVNLNTLLNPNDAGFMYGTVKFISTDSSSAFEMLDIYNYDTYVAQRPVTTTDYKLIDKTTPANTVTLDPHLISLIVTKNGNEAEPTSITTGDVVLYAESLDSSYATVSVSSQTASGKVASVNTSNRTAKIGGNTYDYSDYFETYMSTKENTQLEPGLNVKAYTDALGTLQWGTVTSSETFYPYAYVVNAYQRDDSFYLRLFAPTSTATKSLTSTTSYDVKSFRIADNARLDGAKTSGGSIVSALAASSDTPGEHYQFIRVEFNALDEVVNVIRNSGSLGSENIDSTKLVKYSDRQTVTVTSNTVKSSSGATLYSVSSTIPLFVIPTDRDDEESYALSRAISAATMKTDGTQYQVEAYDLNNQKYPAFVALYGNSNIKSGTPISIDTKYSFIGKKGDKIFAPEHDDSVDTYNTYDQATASAEKKFSPSQEAGSEYSSMQKGDIALLGYDKDGYVNDVNVVIPYSAISNVLTNDATFNWTNDTTFEVLGTELGVIGATGGKNIKATMYNVLQTLADSSLVYVTRDAFSGDTLPDTHRETLNVANAKIIKYNSTDDIITEASINDLKDATNFGTDCSKIAVTSYQSSSSSGYAVRFIVIYE